MNQDKIVQYLRNNENYLSGEEMCRSLEISRAGIWKCIQELRRQGYDIVAVPHLGYKLLNIPDKLYPREIKEGLATKTIGQNIIHYDSISSTMDEAFRQGMEGAGEGTVVCCEHQAKGRGRLGRSWVSPKGKGIYMSLVLRPPLQPTQVSQLTPLCAVAVAEAVEQVCGLKAAIKWPNDVLVNGKKLAGILTELNGETDRVRFVVMGIGLNVNQTSQQLLENATSLKVECQHTISRVVLIRSILEHIEQWYRTYLDRGFAPVIKRWKDLSFTLGKFIRIEDANNFIEGKAVDIAEDGGLIIENNEGTVLKKMTGDVIQVG